MNEMNEVYEVNEVNEAGSAAKATFSKVGVIYTIFSVVVTLLQLVAGALVGLGMDKHPFRGTYEFQILVNCGILYVVGLLVLGIGFKRSGLERASIDKHRMSVGSFFKAFCMCYALLILSNLVGTAFTMFIGQLKGSPVINPIEEVAMNMSLPIMLIFTVIGAPIFEELFFRRYLVDRTLPYGEFLTCVLSGFMFGLFHGNLSQFPYAFTIGIFFAYLYIRTGRIIYSVLMHALVNFLGSIAGSLVLKAVDPELLASTAITGTEEEMIHQMIELFSNKGFVLLMIYEAFVLSLVVIGLILWILEIKKFTFKVTEKELPKRGRFATALCNPGMLAYTVVWVIMIIIYTI